MLSPLNPANQEFLADLNRISDRLNAAQRDVSTGTRLHSVSDNPDQVSTLLQARADLAASRAVSDNLGRVKIEVDTAEKALQSAVGLFGRVRTLGAAGASSTNSAETRAAIAQELGVAYGELVGITNTTVEGRFIFSGDLDQNVPYTLDLSQATPLSAYGGSTPTRKVQHPNGTEFGIALSAQDIFDSADLSTNVFAVVDALRTALLANDDKAISAAVQNLSKADTYLNRQLSFYGATQNRVSAAQEFGLRQQLQLQGQISGIEDTDLTEAILTLNQAKLNQEAALQAHAQIPQRSLFDFLR